MKITREQFEEALIAGLTAVSAGPGARPRYENAISAALASLGIEVDDSCQCSTTVREYCASNKCHGGSRIGVDDNDARCRCPEIECEHEHRAMGDETIWVPRTWIDVRIGDIVRPAGQTDDTHASTVLHVGPVNYWHVSPNGRTGMDWASIPVTLESLHGDERRTFTAENGMKPDAPVDIQVTRAELRAIEAFGGWIARVGVLESNA